MKLDVLAFLEKNVKKIELSIKYQKNNRHFT